MKPLLIIIIYVLTALGVFAEAPRGIVVVDSLSGRPLSHASVFTVGGTVAGLTDANGRVPALSRSDFPVTVRYMGYAPATLDAPADTLLRLAEASYHLPELLVGNGRREVLYLTGYVREFSTLTTAGDTVTLFREKMVDFMVPTSKAGKYKGWLNPRLLSSRSFYRFTNGWGLDSVSDRFSWHFSWSDWLGITDRIPIPYPMQRDSLATDTVMGRYSPAMIWRRRGDRIYLTSDILADTTGRAWAPDLSMFIRDTDFTLFTMNFTFDDVGNTEVLADNLSRISANIETTGRNRNVNRAFALNQHYFVETYAEIYITDRMMISVADARYLSKHPPTGADVAIMAPDDAPALPPAVCEIVERVNAINTDLVRIDTKTDSRIGGYKDRDPRKKSFLQRLKRKVTRWTGR